MEILERLAIDAVRLGFDTLEVEYKNGFDEVCGLKNGIGVGIARFRSSTPEATALRQQLYKARKKVHRVALQDAELRLTTRVWKSFGEDAFHVSVRHVPRSGSARRQGKGSRTESA
jgi:hypothetical protein